MANDRTSIFDSGDAAFLGVSSFKPKTAANADAVPVAHLRAIAETSQLPRAAEIGNTTPAATAASHRPHHAIQLPGDTPSRPCTPLPTGSIGR